MVDAVRLPFVRVVVLNWNSGWLTARCLRSLVRSDYALDRFEVVVVDNASIDGSLAELRAEFGSCPNLRFVENEDNLGFAEGCNRAMRDLDDVDYVALVNNDATVALSWLSPLVEAAEADPALGAVCPVIELEAPYVDLAIEPLGADTVLERVRVDGFDVTRRCLVGELDVRTHDHLPLEFVRHVRRPARVGVPLYVGPPDRRVRVDLEFSVGGVTEVVACHPTLGEATVRMNSAGTALTDWCEGFEPHFGRPTSDAPSKLTEVWGWSGGGVLLRARMLAEVGLFDPRFFAYYEDTDLAWRARRAGWTAACEPRSRLRHQHGGSAGPTARPFFFLNYRNWLLTVLRNGDRAQRGAARRRLAQQSLPFVRRQVTGRLRRGQRPRAQVPLAWARAVGGALELWMWVRKPPVRPVGSRPHQLVRSRLMPASTARPPAHRPGGPRLVYIDVTETLRSGWRAGIQRVTAEMVRSLGAAAPEQLEVVPITFCSAAGRFRRIDADEHRSLLEPTARQAPDLPEHRAAPSGWRRLVGGVGRRLGVDRVIHRIRARRNLAALSPEHRILLLDRLEPGAVFIDVDATWNVGAAPRARILAGMVDAGVEVVPFLHDLLPVSHPEWFEPHNAGLFRAHVEAHARVASMVLVNSEATARAVRAWLDGQGRDPAVVAVPLGTDHASAEPIRPAGLELDAGDVVVLVVGTIEPRKQHALVLDAFDALRDTRPFARLVVVGRSGWGVDTTVTRLRRASADAGSGITWLDRASDGELEWLYRRADVVVVASADEGFGLPAAEALDRGVALVCADRGALPEVCSGHAVLFDPVDWTSLVDVLAPLLDEPVTREAATRKAQAWPARSWDRFAAAVADALSSLPDPRSVPDAP